MARRSDRRSAPGRVISVLEALPSGRPSLDVGQIARCTGLSNATAYRIVGELVDLGIIERRGSDVAIATRL